jgi:hypothetical protein
MTQVITQVTRTIFTNFFGDFRNVFISDLSVTTGENRPPSHHRRGIGPDNGTLVRLSPASWSRSVPAVQHVRSSAVRLSASLQGRVASPTLFARTSGSPVTNGNGMVCPSLRAVTLPVSQHFRVCGLHRFAEGAATPQRFGSPTGWDLHPSRKRGQRSRHCAGWFWRRHHVKVQDCRSLPAVTSPGRLPLVSPSARQAWGCPSHMLRQVQMTLPRTTPPYSADVSMEIASAVRELNPQTGETCTHRRGNPSANLIVIPGSAKTKTPCRVWQGVCV